MKPAKSLFKLTLISGVMSALFSAQTFATEAELSVAEKIAAAINHINQLPDEMKTVKIVEADKAEDFYIIPADNNKSVYIENAGGFEGAEKLETNGIPNPVIIFKNNGTIFDPNHSPSDLHPYEVHLKGTKLYFHNQKEGETQENIYMMLIIVLYQLLK